MQFPPLTGAFRHAPIVNDPFPPIDIPVEGAKVRRSTTVEMAVGMDTIERLCAIKAKHGEFYFVHRYKYSHRNVHRTAQELCSLGRLSLHHQDGDGFYYFRPQDAGVIAEAERRRHRRLLRTYEKNVVWHLEQAATNPGCAGFELRRAEEARSEIRRLTELLCEATA